MQQHCINCGYDLVGLSDPRTCPECGSDPLVSARDPDGLVDLTQCGTGYEADILAAALEDEGIPCRAWSRPPLLLPTGFGGADPIRVQVRRRDIRKAREALRAFYASIGVIDWSAVDTEDFTPLTESEREPAREPGPTSTIARIILLVVATLLLIGADAGVTLSFGPYVFPG